MTNPAIFPTLPPEESGVVLPSFVVETEDATLWGVAADFWSVPEPTGDIDADFNMGRELALEALAYAYRVKSFHVIVYALAQQTHKGRLSGIELGFQSRIASAAFVGRHA